MPGYTYDYDNRNYFPAAPVAEIIVKGPRIEHPGIQLTALLDSGGDATMLPVNVLHRVNALYVETRQMRGVVSYPIEVDTYLATIQIGIYTLPGIEVIAMDNDAEAIIGRDVLNQLIVTMNGLASVVEISQ